MVAARPVVVCIAVSVAVVALAMMVLASLVAAIVTSMLCWQRRGHYHCGAQRAAHQDQSESVHNLSLFPGSVAPEVFVYPF